MSMLGIWIVSIIATLYIADQKKLGALGFFILSILLGPIAVLIVLILPAENIRQREDIQGVNNLEDAKQQLRGIQHSLYALEEKTKNLESLLAKLSGSGVEVSASSEKEIRSVAEPVERLAEPIERPEVGVALEAIVPVKRTDMELDFGRNWLNKIGIVVLALGVAFLISYSFKYFGPFLKIAFGYLVGGALFFTGLKLEAKEKFMNYGRVLLGGAWAIIYFTTYAMHHFEASRIIVNQGADVFLLALVVAGMMTHVLKYKSEAMMSVALCVAYLTSTIGQITSFTIISSLFLAVFVLFLVYRFQWVKTLSLGIALTYGIHFIWVMPNLLSSAKTGVPFGIAALNYYDFMNFVFLSCYWLVFLVGVHIVRTIKDQILVRTLAVTNFGNIALYSALSYPLILKLFYAQRFMMVLIAGLIYLACALLMKRLGREKMYISDIVAAVFAVTFSISLKFLPTSTLLMWMIEIPFLLFIGTNFKEKVFRYFSYILSVVVAMRILFLGFDYLPDVCFLWHTWTWGGFMCFWASISMAVCFYLLRRARKDSEVGEIDLFFKWLFAFATCVYATAWIWSLTHQRGALFSLSMEGLALLLWLIEVPLLVVIGNILKEKTFRYFGYALIISLALRLIAISLFKSMPNIHFLWLSWAWFDFASFWSAVSAATCFCLTQRMKKVSELNSIDVFFDQIFSGAFCVYLTAWLLSVTHYPWQAFFLSMEGFGLLGLSVFLALRRFRVYAYLAMIISAMVFLFESITAATFFMKWFIVSFDVLGMFGLYYAIKVIKQRKLSELFFEYEAELAFAAGIILLAAAIHQYVLPQWISLSLGLASVAMMLIGFSDGNKAERMGGMALLALTLGRVILVDLSDLDIIFKIITLIILGVLFLGVSYVYNRFSIEKK